MVKNIKEMKEMIRNLIEDEIENLERYEDMNIDLDLGRNNQYKRSLDMLEYLYCEI